MKESNSQPCPFPDHGARNTPRHPSSIDLESTSVGTIAPTASCPSSRRDKPPTQSAIAALSYMVLTVTAFSIAIPTEKKYTNFFGISDELAGILVGLVPLFSAASQPFLVPIYSYYPLRNIMFVNDAVAMTGNVLYALGGVSGSYGTVLAGRALFGVTNGPLMASTYVSRSTDAHNRSKYMEYVSIAIGSGYALGPLLGLLLEYLCDFVPSSKVFNSTTSAGWLMAVLFLMHGIYSYFTLEEPPRQGTEAERRAPTVMTGANDAHGLATVHEALKRMLLCYFLVFLVPASVAGWEVITVLFATSQWNWTIKGAAAYLALLNVASVLLSAVKIERWVKSDRIGIAVSFIGSTVASFFFLVNPSSISSLHIANAAAIYGAGAIVLLFSGQVGKGYLFSKASKLPSSSMWRWLRPDMNKNAMCYMLGRATGALVTPFLTAGSNFAFFLLGLNMLGAVAVAVFWGALDGS